MVEQALFLSEPPMQALGIESAIVPGFKEPVWLKIRLKSSGFWGLRELRF